MQLWGDSGQVKEEIQLVDNIFNVDVMEEKKRKEEEKLMSKKELKKKQREENKKNIAGVTCHVNPKISDLSKTGSKDQHYSGLLVSYEINTA